jgi:hypothetical protein
MDGLLPGPGGRQSLNRAPELLGGLEWQLLAAFHRFDDAGHASGISPVKPNNVHTWIAHSRILPT